MKHVKMIARPRLARQDATFGQILTVVAAIMTVIGTQLAAKQPSTSA